MTPKIIVFFGPMYSGKSACARILVELLKRERVSVLNFSAPIKALGESVGMDCYVKKSVAHAEYGMSAREFMRSMGDLFRAFPIHPKYSLTTLIMKRKIEDTTADLVIIDDLRYREEYEMLKEKGALFVRVSRSSVSVDDSHSSETESAQFEADYVIQNDAETTQPLREDLAGMWEALTGCKISDSPVARTLPKHERRRLREEARARRRLATGQSPLDYDVSVGTPSSNS